MKYVADLAIEPVGLLARSLSRSGNVPFERHALASVHFSPNLLNRSSHSAGMSLGLLKFSDGSVDDYAICRSS